MDLASNYDPALLGTAAYGDLIMDGDLQLTSDAANYPNGTNPVLQSILQRLRTFLGEYFLDNSLGVPWLQTLLANNGANSSTDATIQNTILATPGVQMLTSYSSSYNATTRALSVSFAVNTVAGQVSYKGAVSPNAEVAQ